MLHINIEKKDLLDGVQLVQSVVDKKNTIPVLANILLEAEPQTSTVRLVATNLEVGMSTKVPMNEGTEGSITLPAQKIFEILRELPDAPINLTVADNNRMTLKCANAHFELAGLPKSDFPELPSLPSQDMIVFPQAVLREMIAKTAFAVSHDESRYALTGLLLSIKPQEISMVATDGHRLAFISKPHNIELGSTLVDVIIPLKAITEVKKLCESGGSISINLSDTQIAFRTEWTMLVSRLIDAQFPDYKQVIPQDSRVQVTVEKESFYRAVRRVALLCSDSKLLKFTVGAQRLGLVSNDPNLGEAAESLPVDYAGDELTIGFNAKYVLDFLSVINGDKIRIGLNDSISPGLLTSEAEADAGLSYVIMPMRV
jgi:DNA polymerase-3 subunit beta